MLCVDELDIIKDTIREQGLYYNEYITHETIQAGKTLVEYLKGETTENIENIVEEIMAELEEKSPYIVVWWYSVLLFIDKDDKLTKKFVKYVRDNQYIFSLNTRYFLYCQLKNILYSEKVLYSEYAGKILKKFFDEIVDDFVNNISISLEKIPDEKRDNSRTVVITSQFIDRKCKMTDIVLDRCKELTDTMKQNVLLINTADILSTVGKIPFYNTKFSQSIPKKARHSILEYKGVQIQYVQCDYPMPTVSQLELILNEILTIAPKSIILLGEDNIFGELVNKMIPVVNEKSIMFDVVYSDRDNQLDDRNRMLEIFPDSKKNTDYQEILEEQIKNFYNFSKNKKYNVEECSLEFYPYEEEKYCIWNKNTGRFENKFAISDIRKVQCLNELKKHEFWDITLWLDDDFIKNFPILKQALQRKVYIICEDLKKIISYYKLPELNQYMKNVWIFKNEDEYQNYFHEHTDVYLPKLIFASDSEKKRKISEIISKEHEYRLTDVGRNRDNILLTIGIPTHNRGNLLLKRLEKLLKMNYDAEIEIVVCKNGNDLYQSEYDEAAKIDDARIFYYGTDEELIPHLNWLKVVKNAHGRYVVFVSDEDDINISALEHYLKIISTNENIAVIRTKTHEVYAGLQETYGTKGTDAFLKAFLSQNYLSGLIVNRSMFNKANLIKFEKYYQSNKFYQDYPHEWWCSELCLNGDYLQETVELIVEGKNVLLEEYEKIGGTKKLEAFEDDSEIPRYATYESRFQQFEGQIEAIKLFVGNDINGCKTGVDMAINKLVCLLCVARDYGYKKDEYLKVVKKFAHLSMKAISMFSFTDSRKIELLESVKNCCNFLAKYDAKRRMIEDVE